MAPTGRPCGVAGSGEASATSTVQAVPALEILSPSSVSLDKAQAVAALLEPHLALGTVPAQRLSGHGILRRSLDHDRLGRRVGGRRRAAHRHRHRHSCVRLRAHRRRPRRAAASGRKRPGRRAGPRSGRPSRPPSRRSSRNRAYPVAEAFPALVYGPPCASPEPMPISATSGTGRTNVRPLAGPLRGPAVLRHERIKDTWQKSSVSISGRPIPAWP